MPFELEYLRKKKDSISIAGDYLCAFAPKLEEITNYVIDCKIDKNGSGEGQLASDGQTYVKYMYGI